MTEEKQIKEMAKVICGSNKDCKTCVHHFEIRECGCLFYAKRIYDAGYRKQIDRYYVEPGKPPVLIETSENKQSEGEWEIVKGSNGKEKMVCTNCRHGQDLYSTFTYCPNCGARMHGAKRKGGVQE